MSLGGAIVTLNQRITINGSNAPAANAIQRRRDAAGAFTAGSSTTPDVTSRNSRPSFFTQAAQPAVKPARAKSPDLSGIQARSRQIRATVLRTYRDSGTSADCATP